MTPEELQEEYYFDSWYKTEFCFHSKDDSKVLTFTPYYRSNIANAMTIENIIKEGCENIHLQKEDGSYSFTDDEEWIKN